MDFVTEGLFCFVLVSLITLVPIVVFSLFMVVRMFC